MKIQMMIGATVAVFYLINNQANVVKEDSLSSPSLIIEAIVEYYPNASVEEAKVLMKSESHSSGHEAENLETGNKMGTEAGQEKYIINTERF